MANSNRAPSRAGSAQLSNRTLLDAIHHSYLESTAYQLDARTSIVVNGLHESTERASIVDASIGRKLWEHTRRRGENNCVVLQSLHASSPSLIIPFLDTVPFTIPTSVYTSLDALQPFLHCVTPQNPSTPRHAALALTLDVNSEGQVKNASLSLPLNGIDIISGLLDIEPEAGHRAFDVFYYLLTSVSTLAEREFLSLKPASHYSLLRKSGTYKPSPHLATADDAAAADDFRQALRGIGIRGSVHRGLISYLAGLLAFGNTLEHGNGAQDLTETCEEAGILLGIAPSVLVGLSPSEGRAFIGKAYEQLVGWVILKSNESIATKLGTGKGGAHLENASDDAETGFCITVIDIPDPSLGKAIALQSIFDPRFGVNAEAVEDGIAESSTEPHVSREIRQAMLNSSSYERIFCGRQTAEERYDDDIKHTILEKVGLLAEEDSFLKNTIVLGKGKEFGWAELSALDLHHVLDSSRIWYQLSLYPGSDPAPETMGVSPPTTWSSCDVSAQLLSWRLRDWANQRFKNFGFTVDFDIDEFLRRYSILGCCDGNDDISAWLLEQGWSSTEAIVGQERVWMSEEAWWQSEMIRDTRIAHKLQGGSNSPQDASSFWRPERGLSYLNPNHGQYGSSDHLFSEAWKEKTLDPATASQRDTNGVLIDLAGNVYPTKEEHRSHTPSGLLKGHDIQVSEDIVSNDPELAKRRRIQTKHVTMSRRLWVGFVWSLTFWIPSPLLIHIGRMRRPDVRQAWREKLVLFSIILFLNAMILFWMIGLGKLLCPNSDKAWNRKEVSTHQGETDFWVSIHGKVYDISDFWKRQHSDTDTETTTSNMQPLAGLDMDAYFVPPLYKACKNLGISERTRLTANSTPEYTVALHTSGYYATDSTSALGDSDWYWTNFEPSIKEYYHGYLVTKKSKVKSEGKDGHMWVTYGNQIYDLTDYFYTRDLYSTNDKYGFLNSDISSLWEDNAGENIKQELDALIEGSVNNRTKYNDMVASWKCIQNIGYSGILDFRDSVKCQINSWLLLAFTIMVCAIIIIKFLAALQLGSARIPTQQNKFVICQIPAYTEDEDSLRKAIDSITALKYDNTRKLLCIICDGIAVGKGNNRPTPKIVLEILGADQRVDPPVLPFKSVGTGSEQLNYGQIYSGLYGVEGNIVPFIVVVKVGRESEQSRAKPGNRGKRDSQILLLSFLNRVHHNAPMNPLELELFHHINDIIGVDPRHYEFLLMVDADTSVQEDALNHLVAACTHNTKIAGICGETTLDNDERSWWTMIQIYEYFISHHLAKAFESLFGSVTCLPGCFTMYRLRTADTNRPLLISDAVIRDYSVCDVETLHMKNLLSLGEDRYLTTLMIKHFPRMWLKFLPGAQCKTAAPESWAVLLSQRRRWINSTIHNLVELMRLEDMCGVCCFSMRAIVFADLFGTIIFPATCVYLAYLIYRVATNTGQFPLISIILLAATYGLQVLLFIVKLQWQHIGWMVIYIMALPVYSLALPLYSFWNQDNFSWGNTRVVIGEKGDKQLIAVDDEEDFDPTDVPLQRWGDCPMIGNVLNRRSESARQETVHWSEPRSSCAMEPMVPIRHTPTLRQQLISRPTPSPRTEPWDRQSTVMYARNDVGSLDELGSVMHDSLVPNFAGQNLSEPSRGSILDAVELTLQEVDLDTVTKRQVRSIVERRLRAALIGDNLDFFSYELDGQLQKMM
ncbi:class VII chitin synthase [Dactylonectria estremocensis]|uniref:chitin synthase n=1 Tax=Dactylonectria estremocensis TaxID=1079267 RepID=A0A9P9DMK3_9HYPO|nr:class VII chitin synthase [Dactylonectria estremocensis]